MRVITPPAPIPRHRNPFTELSLAMVTMNTTHAFLPSVTLKRPHSRRRLTQIETAPHQSSGRQTPRPVNAHPRRPCSSLQGLSLVGASVEPSSRDGQNFLHTRFTPVPLA